MHADFYDLYSSNMRLKVFKSASSLNGCFKFCKPPDVKVLSNLFSPLTERKPNNHKASSVWYNVKLSLFELVKLNRCLLAYISSNPVSTSGILTWHCGGSRAKLFLHIIIIWGNNSGVFAIGYTGWLHITHC